MPYNVIVLKEAILDLKEAFEWYEEQSIDLGYQLFSEVETCYHQISENPEHYSFFNQTYRRIKTRRFPYVIIFEIIGDDIIVNSIKHAKRQTL